MSKKATVLVVGSANIDLIATVPRLPGPGETIGADNLLQRFGGKGANQAIAAARQGARVSFIGCVGNDDNGGAYISRLKQEGINTSGVSLTARALTGTALIAVDQQGENLIVVAPGANGELRTRHLASNRALFEAADLLLAQFEVPMRVVVEAVRLANRVKLPVILNPSPWRQGFPWGQVEIDTVIVNGGEARMLFGANAGEGSPRQRQFLRSALERKRVNRVIITHGAKPTFCLSREEQFCVAALRVKPLDTVGAGDTFAGTYAAMRAQGLGVGESVRLANCAGALATLKRGAQESIPTRAETRKAEARLP